MNFYSKRQKVMAFDLKEINFAFSRRPQGFIEECDDVYANPRMKDMTEKNH